MRRTPLAKEILLALTASLIGISVFAYRYLSFVEFSNDHFVHLSTAQQITHGALPVRDYVERGLPLMSLMSAAGQTVLGVGLKSEVVLIALAFAVAAGFTFTVAARLSGSVFAAVASLLPVLVYPVSYSYPKLLAPALGFLAAWSYCVRPTTTRLALLAACTSIAFLFRHDLGVVLGAASVVLLIVRHGIGREGLVWAGTFALFAVVIVSPYLAWVQIYEGLGTYLHDGVAFSRREAQKANWWQPSRFAIDSSRPFVQKLGHGPVINVRWQSEVSDVRMNEAERSHGLIRQDLNSPRSWQYELTKWSTSDLEHLVKDPLVADTQGIDRTAFRLQVPAPEGLSAVLLHVYGPAEGLRVRANSFAALFYIVWIVPIGAGIVFAATWRRSTAAVRGMVAMAVVLQLAMNATMLRDPLDTRIRDVLVPAAVLTAYLAGSLWHAAGGIGARALKRVVVAAVLIVIVAGAGAVGEAGAQVNWMGIKEGVPGVRKRLRSIRRILSPPDHRTGRVLPHYQPLVDYITKCTKPDSRLLTMTFAPELFFYTAREFAGGQVSMSPGFFSDDRHGSLMVSRLSREDVPLVIMDNETQNEMFEYARVGGHLRAHYHEVGRFPVRGTKEFVVLAENGRHPLGTFGSTHLPCFVS